jgi:hypothetical protein
MLACTLHIWLHCHVLPSLSPPPLPGHRRCRCLLLPPALPLFAAATGMCWLLLLLLLLLSSESKFSRVRH